MYFVLTKDILIFIFFCGSDVPIAPIQNYFDLVIPKKNLYVAISPTINSCYPVVTKEEPVFGKTIELCFFLLSI